VARPDARRFDSFASDYAYWRTVELQLELYEDLLDFVPRPDVIALDAGCGSGPLAGHLASRCRAVIGIDISLAMLHLAQRECRRHGITNVHLVAGDLEAPPFRASVFGFVLACYSLQHTPLELTLPALRRTIAGDGRLAIAAFVSYNPDRDASWLWAEVYWLRQAPYYLRRHGLRVAWRIMRFLVGRRWINHVTRHGKLTLERLADECARVLPGYRIETRGELAKVRWDAAGSPTRSAPA